jgi:hypothetical protein
MAKDATAAVRAGILYFHLDGVDELYESVKGQVESV